MDCRDVEDSGAQFKCLCCEAHFGLKTPVKNSRDVKTELIEAGLSRDQFLARQQKTVQEVRKCLKCAALNPKSLEECLKCGVIFARLEGLPLDQQLGAIPSLVRSWQELMSDYQNLRKHFEFVDRCEDLNAIPFALRKYEELKSVQPHDEIAQSMFQKVIMKRFANVSPEQWAWLLQVRRQILALPWMRILRVGPVVLGTILIFIGLAAPGLRNLVGLGVAMAFVTVGFVVFNTGRFDLRDFWSAD